MLMNLTDIFLTENKVEEKELNLELNTINVFGNNYQIVKASPLMLKLQNEGKGRVLIQGKVDLTLRLNCDRCLKEVLYPMDLDFEEVVTSPEFGDSSEEDDDEGYMDGYQLKLDDLLVSNIVLNWPMKILCREDCKGICKICGKDLNTGECGCDRFVPSPGLAGIKEIFNANKEV